MWQDELDAERSVAVLRAVVLTLTAVAALLGCVAVVQLPDDVHLPLVASPSVTGCKP